MRLAFRAQQEREAQTYAANQALISEMSHDLRTPLTTLLLYTEILRYGKYQGEEQLHAYLDRVDEKAQQIKQLAENILEYSLAAQNRPVELQEPLPAQEVLGEAFTRPSPTFPNAATPMSWPWTLERRRLRCTSPISAGWWTISPPIF